MIAVGIWAEHVALEVPVVYVAHAPYFSSLSCASGSAVNGAMKASVIVCVGTGKVWYSKCLRNQHADSKHSVYPGMPTQRTMSQTEASALVKFAKKH